MDPETTTATDPMPPSGSRKALTILAVIAVIAAVVAIVALMSSRTDESAAAPTTGIPQLSDLAGTSATGGDTAPNFTVPTLDGGSFDLAAHQAEDGRPVFLNLWASWCFPCRAEMPAIDAASQNHPEVLFIGVAVADDNAAAADFAKEIDVQYTIGFDADEQVADGYPVLGMPGTFLISSDGIIVKTIFGGVDEAEVDVLLAEAFGA